MEHKEVVIPGVNCGHCTATIEKAVGEMDGVQAVSGNPETKRVLFSWQNPASWDAIVSKLEEIGFPPQT